MNGREHRYQVTVRWIGNLGSGTGGYTSYSRDHEIEAAGNPPIPGSSDPAFRGDPARWNPEELFVAAVCACHKLWYLHLAAVAGIRVTGYVDRAEGVMVEGAGGAGRFTMITLRPEITVEQPIDLAKAEALHAEAHAKCFIANSIKTPVRVQPVFLGAGGLRLSA
ncbi:MAG TPA: OsmC family protein [Hyphomicrobiaceae bacterium]|nr:OsmC family protein [Hyphomicrobiaceae bacterium]